MASITEQTMADAAQALDRLVIAAGDIISIRKDGRFPPVRAWDALTRAYDKAVLPNQEFRAMVEDSKRQRL